MNPPGFDLQGERWLQRDWPDGSVVFDCHTGDTHFLPAEPDKPTPSA